ncbi:MAG: ABC transporter permease [Saprospiraceae bacterium]
MDKILLIIQREYLTRVKKKSFLLATLLTPLGIAAFIVVASLIFGYESDESKRIAVIDESGVITGGIKDEASIKFSLKKNTLEELKQEVRDDKYDGVLVIPAVNNLYSKDLQLLYYSEDGLTLDVEGVIKNRVRDYVRDYKAAKLGLEEKSLDALNFKTYVEPEPIDEGGDNASKMTGAIGAGIGTAMGFVMYLTIFIYGMMVMRSVQEEKTTRIVEVMISSVKPFQLMLGKIIGVGLVGLTQVLIWAALIPLVIMGLSFFFGFESPSSTATSDAMAAMDPEDMENMMMLAMTEIQNQNWWAIVPLFLIYFLGGYFLYASLFAAVGSAMGEDQGESQALTIPITIPVVLAIYIMFAVVQAPNSTLAMWSSQFPMFSPIVMPARLAFGPPIWEVALSVTILVATSIFFVWLSARIYRTGILLYGKKIGFKELGKWMWRG